MLSKIEQEGRKEHEAGPHTRTQETGRLEGGLSEENSEAQKGVAGTWGSQHKPGDSSVPTFCRDPLAAYLYSGPCMCPRSLKPHSTPGRGHD